MGGAHPAVISAVYDVVQNGDIFALPAVLYLSILSVHLDEPSTSMSLPRAHPKYSNVFLCSVFFLFLKRSVIQDTHLIKVVYAICMENLKSQPVPYLRAQSIQDYANTKPADLAPLPDDASEECIAARKIEESQLARELEIFELNLQSRRMMAEAEAQFFQVLRDLQFGAKFLWDAMQLSSGVEASLRVS